MRKESLIFNKINQRPEFKYTQAQISQWSGQSRPQINRFMKGETDLPTSKFLGVVSAMPEDFQRAYWFELLGDLIALEQADWQALLEKASFSDIAVILEVIGKRCGKLNDRKLKSEMEIAKAS
ncbi:MAG: hypothetical protein ACFBSE_16825 [Prochloraceae cyanobacterium]